MRAQGAVIGREIVRLPVGPTVRQFCEISREPSVLPGCARSAPIDLTIQTAENEPCVLDIDLAEQLGFDHPLNIRNLTKRHEV